MIELYIKLDLSLYLNFPLYDLKIGQKVRPSRESTRVNLVFDWTLIIELLLFQALSPVRQIDNTFFLGKFTSDMGRIGNF